MLRRHISKEAKEMALRMALDCGLSKIEIAEYTGIRPRTMRRLLQRYRETGEVVRKPVVSGRPRLMNALDATVSPHHVLPLYFSVFYTVSRRAR